MFNGDRNAGQRKSRKESTTKEYVVNFLCKFIIVFANVWQKGSFCQDIRYGREDNYLGLLPNDSRMHLLEQGSLCFVQLQLLVICLLIVQALNCKLLVYGICFKVCNPIYPNERFFSSFCSLILLSTVLLKSLL